TPGGGDRAGAEVRTAQNSPGLSVSARSRPVERGSTTADTDSSRYLGARAPRPGHHSGGCGCALCSPRPIRVTDAGVRDILIRRAAAAGIEVPPDVVDPLVRYWDIFARWSRTINLTSLSLNPPSDAAIDRLFLEPLATAAFFPAQADHWVDLGSGGGSPAIPLKIRLISPFLVLTEARER